MSDDKKLQKIKNYLENIPDKDCIEMLLEINNQDLLLTKQVTDLGIDPLGDKTPYIPMHLGRAYAEEGEE